MTRVLFVEGRDEVVLRAFAARLHAPWRLLARPEQGIVLLETTDPGADAEREAGTLPGVKAWAFTVVDDGPRG